ncbi:metallophosphoesterase [Poriferisphaera sp. WC338]|uniref:metallophosphoesterase n=1 Tax=Poriferisphaera sp. WC338 TaxID=3425129 RepID=UPI003D8199C2
MPLAYGLIEPVDISLPRLPHSLDGMRVLHLSDLHIRRRSALFSKLINQLTSIRHDLTVFTGDYMSLEGDEEVAYEVMAEICDRLRPTHGMYGTFGNHDYDRFRELAQKLPIRWLTDEAARCESAPIDVFGFNATKGGGPDSVKTALSAAEVFGGESAEAEERLKIGLLHYPDHFGAAADLGADLALAGHTHGGQMRLPGGRAFHNSSTLPNEYSAGLMRHQNMMMGLTRGLGFAETPRVFEFRTFCPAQMPLYTLRRGALPGKYEPMLEMVEKW